MRASSIEPNKRYILVFNEKHADRYFVVLNQQELESACWKILSERFHEGCWYYAPEESDKPKAPDYTMEQAKQLKGEAQKAAIREVVSYNSKLRTWDREQNQYIRIKNAVESKDTKAAYELLKERGDYEYEGLSLEQSEDFR